MTVHQNLSGAALEAALLDLGQKARASSIHLAAAGTVRRTKALRVMADQLRADAASILAENEKDMSAGKAKSLAGPMLERLALTPARLEGMAAGLEAIAALPDPVGEEVARWTVPSGLDIARVRTPLGVIGIIYESRPNVTADAGGLCIRSGNSVILRGGSESRHTSSCIVESLRTALRLVGLPEDAIQHVPTTDRAAVGYMLKGLGGALDVLVPRGGKSLVARVTAEARVPVIGHLEGLVHMYVDGTMSAGKAAQVILNAKMRRVGICGALETLLVDRGAAADLLPEISEVLLGAGCTLRGDVQACALVPAMEVASEVDWQTEYLAPILAVRLVDGLEGALAHIAQYGSGHTEAILTEDAEAACRFLNQVDAGIVMHNASTQFADGGEFGMGAEIGIATGRIHARGPVGAEQLTIFKYQVRGTGQIRPL